MKNSLYDKSLEQNTNIKSGIDYNSNNILLKRTMSPYMFNNEIMENFLQHVGNVVAQNIDSVKRIRIHNNFTTDKDNIKIY